MAKTNHAPIVTELDLARETPRTFRFETGAAGAPITPLYVQQDAFTGDSKPQRVRVTVEVIK